MTETHKLRVLFVGPLPPPVHGVTLCLQTLLAHRDRLPVEIVHLDSRFTSAHGNLGKFSARKVWLLARYLARFTHQLLFERIYRVVVAPTFYFKPFLKDSLFIWWAWILRKPVVGWIHNDFWLLNQEMQGWRMHFARLTLQRLERLVIVSPRLGRNIPEWLAADRVTPIENGVPDPPRHRNWSLTPGKNPRFIYLSQMNESKGWMDLLESAGILASRGHVPRIDFYGCPAFETTQEMIEERFLQARAHGLDVMWHGGIYGDDKWEMMAAADVFVFPSWHEAFPLALLDAMAVGLPVIATNVGGVADALDDGWGGRIVAPRRATELADAMQSMFSPSASLPAMGEYNRQRYLQKFTDEAYANRWAAYFHTFYDAN